MPRENAPETRNVADSVARSTADAAQGLRGVSEAAKTADSDIGKFSSTQAEAARIADKFATAMDNASKSASGLGKATVDARGVAASLSEVTSESERAAGAMDKAKQAAREEASAAKYLSEEMDEVASVTNLVRKSMSDGRREAESFGGGLIKSGSGALAAGAGLVYLTQKAGDFIGKYAEAAKSLSEFNVQSAILAKTTVGFDASQLENLRDELNLTREQSIKFYETLKQGAESGVLSVSELTAAAGKLRDAYGGDPTEKLKEFIELVQTIPTLETDISVTASVDDKAASIFALAKAGKVSALIEAQGAGLLGGVGGGASPEDVKMLNEQQRAIAVQENVKDAILEKLVPPISTHLPVIANAVTETLGVMASILGLAGGIQLFMQKRQVKEQKATTRAVHMMTAKGGGGSISGGKALDVKRIFTAFRKGGLKGGAQAAVRQFSPEAAKAFKVGGMKQGLKVLSKIGKTKVAGTLTKLGLSASSGSTALSGFTASATTAASAIFAVAGPLALASATLGLVGKAADWLSEKLEDVGDEMGASAAKFGSEMAGAASTVAGFAAAGAVIGSVFPVIGTAAGAVVGGLVGLGVELWNSGDEIKDAADDLSEKLRAEGTTLLSKGLGFAVKGYGAIIATSGKAIKSTFKGIWDAGKILGAGILELGKIYVDSRFLSAREVKARMDARKSLRNFNKSLKNASKLSQEASEELARSQKLTQESALDLQRALKGVEAVAAGTTAQLARMRSELAALNLDFFREVGGTVAQFDSAVEQSSNATVEEFQQMNRAIGAQRARIGRMDKLTEEDRRAALDELRKVETEAARKFADAISQLATQLFNTPKIIEEELRKNIASQRFDYDVETGGGNIGEVIDDALSSSIAASNALKGTFEQLEEIEKQAETRRKGFEQATKDAQQGLQDLVVSLPEDVQKAIGASEIKLGEMPIEDVRKKAEDIKAKIEEGNQKINELTKGMAVFSEKGVEGLAKYADGAAKDVENASKAVERAQNALKKEKKGTEEYESASENLAKQREKLGNAVEKEAEVQDKIKTYLAEQGASAKQIAFITAKLTGDQSKINELKKENAGIEGESASLLDDIKAESDRQAKKLKEANELTKKQGKLARAQTVLEDYVGVQRSESAAALKEQQEVEALIFQRAREFNAMMNKVTEAEAQDVKRAQRGLMQSEAKAAYAIATGNVEGQILDQDKKNIELIQAQIKESEAKLKFYKTERKAAEEALAEAKTPAAKKAAEGMIETIDESAAKVEASMSEARGRLARAFKGLEETIGDFMSQPVGRTAQAGLDLAEANFELSKYSDAVAAGIEQNTKNAIDAARERTEIERKAIATWLKNEEARADAIGGEEGENLKTAAQAEAQARLAKAETDEAQAQLDAIQKATDYRMQELDLAAEAAASAKDLAEAFDGSASTMQIAMQNELNIEKGKLAELERQRAEIIATGRGGQNLRKVELEIVKKQNELRKQELEIVKRVADLRREEISTLEEGFEAELDYLDYIGASYSRMLDIQGEMVGLARERYNVEMDLLNDYKRQGVTGQALLQQETKVRKAWFEMQKKSLGVQKGLMDKILGAAFGQLRSSAGARKQVGTVQQIMGVKGSRAYTASGMPVAAGPGGGTIEERSIMRQLSGARGGTPRKLSTEEKLAKAMRGTESSSSETAKWTEETSQATKHLDEQASRRGSLFTHDEGAHGLLAGILAVAKEMAVMMSDESSADVRGRIEDAIKSSQVQAHTDSELQEAKIGDVAKNTKDTANNTDDSSRGTTATAAGIEETRSSLEKNKKELEKLYAVQKRTPEEQKAAYEEVSTAIAELEDTIRRQSQELIGAQQAYRESEMTNPFGGMARGPRIEGYEDIMAGVVDPVITQAANTLKMASEKVAEAQKKTSDELDAYFSQAVVTERTGGNLDKLMEAAKGVVGPAMEQDKELKGRFDAMATDVMKRRDEALKAEEEKYDKRVAKFYELAKTFGETAEGGLTEEGQKAFDEMESAARKKKNERVAGILAKSEDEYLNNAFFVDEAERMRKEAGLETGGEKKARHAQNLERMMAATNEQQQKASKEFQKKYKVGGFGEPTRLEDFKMDDERFKMSDFAKVGKKMGSGLGREMTKQQKDVDRVAIAREVGRTRDVPEGATTLDQYAAKAAAGLIPPPPGTAMDFVSGAGATQEAIQSRTAMPEDLQFQAGKPMAAHIATPGEGSSGGAATLQIKGELNITSNNPLLDGSFATMVARVINTPEVQGEVGKLLRVASSGV